MIRLGLNVANFGPQVDSRILLDWTRFADSQGFAALVVSDHVAPTSEITDTYPDPFYDPLTLIAWLAGQSEQLLFATSVLVVPYRHPLLTARISGMLHEMSGGRFALGVGVGWSQSEFEAVGADFAGRGRVTDQYLDLITRSWQQERVDADIPGMRIEGIATGPRPVDGRVPLWVGGAAGAAIRRAVRFGTAWHPINPDRDWLRDTGIPALQRESERVGIRTPEIIPRIKFRPVAEPLADSGRLLGVGTLEQIADDVCFLSGLGADLVIVDPNPDTPQPRDFETERTGLLELRGILAKRS